MSNFVDQIIKELDKECIKQNVPTEYCIDTIITTGEGYLLDSDVAAVLDQLVNKFRFYFAETGFHATRKNFIKYITENYSRY